MPYYHVYINHHDPSRKGPEEAYELDLSLEELMEQIVNPYLNGKTFMCGGQPIDAFFIDMVIVSKTIESSAELIPKLRAEEDKKSAETGIGWGYSEEYLVIDYGENVTREFITHPPRKKEKETSEKPEKTKQVVSKNVFIVHGRDHEPMKELKKMLIDFGLKPIVLHEQPGGSRTIVEKLEKYSDVGYAFVILTPDDTTSSKFDEVLEKLDSEEEFEIQVQKDSFRSMIKKRARQNVILEFGYFIGKLNRDRVCCLLKGDVERPSDMHGIVYIPFKESVNEVRDKIVKELEAAGYEMKI